MSADTGAVEVGFAVTFDHVVFHDEPTLAAATPEMRANIARRQDIEGALVIAAADRTARIVDDIAPWVQNLCFAGVTTLAAGAPVEVHYFARSGVIRLAPEGDRITLSGDHVPDMDLPRRPLLRGLLATGQRFCAWAAGIKADDPGYMANLNYVRGFEPAAVSALAGETDG